MATSSTPDDEVALETDRLLLRPWRTCDAALLRALWTERDPRVPPHRRIDALGHPTVDDLAGSIRPHRSSSTVGLFALQRKDTGAVIGYCGLIETDRGADGEPELAFELLRNSWNRGFATEAGWAVLDRATRSGHRRLWATVREWNVASRRVLRKLGFTETGRVEPSESYGDNLFMTRLLETGSPDLGAY